MDTRRAADLIWDAYERGEGPPASLAGELDLDTALRVQLDLLERRLEKGERLAGWKIGLTSPVVREHFGTQDQPFGYLLERGVQRSGSTVRLADVRGGCGIEPELCLVMDAPLAGPGVTAADARVAVRAVCPGMEINERRIQGVRDFGLTVADDLTQWGIVVGSPVEPVPDDFESAALDVRMLCDGATQAHVTGGADVIDDHFESVARLANVLARYGRGLETGQHVITGSFSKHDVTARGTWTASFSGLGTASLRFE